MVWLSCTVRRHVGTHGVGMELVAFPADTAPPSLLAFTRPVAARSRCLAPVGCSFLWGWSCPIAGPTARLGECGSGWRTQLKTRKLEAFTTISMSCNKLSPESVTDQVYERCSCLKRERLAWRLLGWLWSRRICRSDLEA